MTIYLVSGTTCTVTARNPVHPPLTELESRVMNAVWKGGPSSVNAVYQSVSCERNLKEVTIRTILRRLEQKGYLRHRVEGRVFVYEATEPARSLAGRAVRQIIDLLCHGSVEELVSGMVDAKVLSKKELDRVAEYVRRRRSGGE